MAPEPPKAIKSKSRGSRPLSVVIRVGLVASITMFSVGGLATNLPVTLDLSSVPNLDPIVLDIVSGLLGQVADLKGEDGTCSRVSTTFVVEGVPAFLFEDEGPAAP